MAEKTIPYPGKQTDKACIHHGMWWRFTKIIWFLSRFYSLFCSLSALNISRAALVCVKENILLSWFLSWPLILEIIYPGFLKYVDLRRHLMELSPMLISYVSFLYNISSCTNLIANKISIYLFFQLWNYIFLIYSSLIFYFPTTVSLPSLFKPLPFPTSYLPIDPLFFHFPYYK